MKKKIRLYTFLLCAWMFAFAPEVWAQNAGFVSGVDISWASEMEAGGMKFYNNGQPADIFRLMKDIGMNAVRLRVWVNPETKQPQLGGSAYGPWSGKRDVVAKSRRAKEAGLDVMIDFHYSDYFADPGKQIKPVAWEGLSFDGLKKALAAHTEDVLRAIKDADINVRWVQIGNETTSGMVWPEGRLMWDSCRFESFGRYAELSNAGYDAVKRVYPDATVIVHHDNGQYDTTWFYDELLQHGGKFDMIGLSLYPDHEHWKTDIDNAAAYAKSMSRHFDVPVMIVETGYSNADEVRAEQVMKELMARMAGVVSGVFYWEPEIYGGWDHTYWDGFWHTSPCVFGKKVVNNGAFTEKGEPSAALRALTVTASAADASVMIHEMRE